MQRQRILVRGIVQGVGFRPFVYGLALRWGLAGFVLNNSAGVTIEVEGEAASLASFLHALQTEAPPLARIDAVNCETLLPLHESGFRIAHSQTSSERVALISPDTATCDDCLRELFDPQDRRYRYPFINCTNCGPRFTIVQDVPYDRDKTTMRDFLMCTDCQAEYDDPLNRRFHAQPDACPVCGPQVKLAAWSDERGQEDLTLLSSFKEGDNEPAQDGLIPSLAQEAHADYITAAARYLASGGILSIKGLGGYHLACDAMNVEAVQRLRQRKHREAKPFALMVPDLLTARQLCYINDAEAKLIQSHRRPIVLLTQRSDCPVAPGIAPGYTSLGIMLPYTPLHHLLLHDFATAIKPGCLPVLVMTSGNLSDEPIAYRDDDAQKRLHPIAEGILLHNRIIHMRCDDSVLRLVDGSEQFFRRSRGYAPEPLQLASELPIPILACGGHLKNTFCLGKGRQAFISHHIGDLENLETLVSFQEGIEHFQRLFAITPEAIVYDLHPEYLATKYALDADIPHKIGVQHHHAHIASVLAEHGLSSPVIGIAADGTGYGTDGAIWGCEVMTADLASFERRAYLDYVPLVGGEQAVRQPWRMAAVYLARTFGDGFLELEIPFISHLNASRWRTLSQMIERGINSPPTSSLGRLFDAVAALLGLPCGNPTRAGTDLSCPGDRSRSRTTDTINRSLRGGGEVLYEGQAAIELEVLADEGSRLLEGDAIESYPFTLQGQEPVRLVVTPLIRAMVEDMRQGISPAQIAYRFHLTLADLLATACLEVRRQSGLNVVALSGGVFQNRLLLEQLIKRLQDLDFQVYRNQRVPPNDGGLSFGQLAVAAARLWMQAH
jgi:hydrogenase maturation protein HypF